MTGYQEMVTDPSFAGQVITFTQPMIGNYGVEEDASESARPHARAIVVREGRNAAPTAARGSPTGSPDHGVVGIQGLDTRMLTRRLRDGGTVRAAVSSDGTPAAELLAAVRARAGDGRPGAGRAVSPARSRSELAAIGAERAHVAVLDYGVKGSIVRILRESGARVTVLPWDATADEVLAVEPDGVLLGNGPGDPAALPDCAAEVRELVGAGAGVRDLPRPPAARPGAGAGDVQAAVRPPRREPPGARGRHRPRAGDGPEPRLRRPRAGRRRRPARPTSAPPGSPTSRSTTAPSRGSRCAICRSARCSSTPRPAPGRTTPARRWSGSSTGIAEGSAVAQA